MLEIIITIIGIVQGVLAMLNKRSNWLVYALQMILLVVFSYTNKLYGDMCQNAVYLLFCIISWFMWSPKNETHKISMLDNKERVITGIIIIACTLVLGGVLKSTDDPLPVVDAFTTTTTVVALFLMAMHKIESWVIWFINDIAYMYQYFNLPDQALYLFGLYVIWTIMVIFSFIQWRKIYLAYD